MNNERVFTPVLMQNVPYPQITRGITRNMQLDLPVSLGGFGEVEPQNVPTPQGGGNLNGSSNTAHLIGQAGTGCARINVARQNQRNYTGII